jgi:hypothetical protein
MATSFLSIFTAIMFVIVAIMFSIGIYYVHRIKNNLNMNKEHMYRIPEYHSNHTNHTKEHKKTIEDNDRVQFITKCNSIDNDLERLLSKQLIAVNNDHKKILMEKKYYVKKIRDIVNDLTFNNKKEFEQLYSVLKEIQKDVIDQNKRLSGLETKLANSDNEKNELANMLIQRMVSDSSQRSLKKRSLLDLLDGEGKDKEDELLLLEKYIIKTIRKQIGSEMNKYPIQAQSMNPVSSNEIERKLELMDLVNHKLRSMENLYKNLHSTNKKQIIEIVKTPVKKTIKPYVKLQNDDDLTKSGLKVHKKDGEANTYYVTD